LISIKNFLDEYNTSNHTKSSLSIEEKNYEYSMWK
jgi:hypothetical protein